jgi:asparagine N-glycosylation enzyme membrane subunit Stt3
VKDGKRAASLPYFHWVFPFCRLRQSGDRVIENGMMASTFEGYALGNEAFGDGLDDRWEYPVATERPYAYARASWAPTGRKGFYEWHGDISKSISNSARTLTTATITTSTAHTFRVGDSVTVAAVTATALNGTFTITAVPTTTTFTYTTTSSGTIAAASESTQPVSAVFSFGKR